MPAVASGIPLNVFPRFELQALRNAIVSRSALSFAIWTGVLGLGAVAMTLAYSWSERQGYARLNDVLGHQLDLYAAALESELGKHEYLPGIVALDNDVQALLAAPGAGRLDEKANKRLAILNVRAGSRAIFVVDRAGLVRAASNWYQPESYVGRDVAAQPFFSEALKGRPARFFSRSATRNAPEYYFAQPVLQGGVLIGVAVVKISLDPIESTWIASTSQSSQEIVLVLDENDVIIIASAPEWRNRRASPISSMLRAGQAKAGQPGTDATLAAADSGQAPKASASYGMADAQTAAYGNQVVRWPSLNPDAPRTLYATQSRVMSHQGWRLITLTNASNVTVNAWQAALGAGVFAAFIGLLGMFLALRRRAITSRLKAREALQRAHDELELRIALRTAELHDMNEELVREIGERKRAEQVLRESQDDLMHASKLALLGQMSAGITHEISQPLTALRSLSFNTQLLLKRGDIGRIEKNLQSISDLTERMGKLTEQLKSFSRKTPLTLESFLLTKAVDATLLLLENRIRTEQIVLDVDIRAPLHALCDGNRLEQVLINLCANALDAMRDAPTKKLAIRVWRANGKAVIRVSDSGTGISEALMGRLFEPFFSTKLPGQGLGLGLAISADIVREFGGTLRAFNIQGGAAFELDLKLTEENKHV